MMRAMSLRVLAFLAAASLAVTGCSDDPTDDTDTTDVTDVTDVDDTNDPAEETSTPGDPDITDGTDTDSDTEEPLGCGPRECGMYNGQDCGTCDDGFSCNAQGRCVDLQPFGGFCGPTTACNSDSNDYPNCLNDQCETNLCAATAWGDRFTLLTVRDWEVLGGNSFCTTSCVIYQDDGRGVNIGAQEDCQAIGLDNAPFGTEFHCVNFASTQSGSDLGYCMPGTTFDECDTSADCPGDESCELTTMEGVFQGRCLAKAQAGPWGDTAGPQEACNPSPDAENGRVLCEEGICYSSSFGCSAGCLTSDDCGSGAECTDLLGLASEGVSYGYCTPMSCDIAAECDEGAYCDWGWNQRIVNAEITGECLPESEDGAAAGEACEESEDCAADMCLGGKCTLRCSDDDQCGEDGLCGFFEFNLDFLPCFSDSDCDEGACSASISGSDDGACYDPVSLRFIEGERTTAALGLNFCLYIEGYDANPEMVGECEVSSDCDAGQYCDRIQKSNFVDGVLDADAPVIVYGICQDTERTGEYGSPCESGSDCRDGYCIPSSDGEGPGFCSQGCTASSQCPVFVDGEGEEQETYSSLCNSYLYDYAGDINTLETFTFIGLCEPTLGSLEDCSDDFTCSDENEACLSNLVAGVDPSKPSTYEALCFTAWDEETAPGTKLIGESCEQSQECASGICINVSDDEENPERFCTSLCSLSDDQCGEELDCYALDRYPRLGDYTENSAYEFLCLKDAPEGDDAPDVD